MKLFLARHPVTKANVSGIINGNDESITEKGYEQIEKFICYLRKESIDSIYSSDSQRCRELAERLAYSKGLIPVYNPLFREINNGDLSGLRKEEITPKLLENLNFSAPNGESLNDLAERCRISYDYLVSQGKERSLLISHGWFLKMFLGVQLGMNYRDSIKKLKFSNCAISELDITGRNIVIEYLNKRDFL